MALPSREDIPDVPPFVFFINGGTLKEPLFVVDPKQVVNKLKELKQHHEPPSSKPIVGVMVRVIAPQHLDKLIDHVVDKMMKEKGPAPTSIFTPGEARQALHKIVSEIMRHALLAEGDAVEMLKTLASSSPNDAQVHFMSEKGEVAFPGMMTSTINGVVELERSCYVNWPKE